MQEEVNEKTISLCIKGGKITAQILKAALIKLLAEMDKKKQRGKGEKGQCKKIGKQSMELQTPAASCMRRRTVQHGQWVTTELLPTFWIRRMAVP